MSLADSAPIQTTDVHRLRAMAHPLRLEMLSLLTGAELSAAEVARELDITQANASYHLRLLHSAGLLVVASEEKVNGGVAKRYRHLWDQPVPQGSRSAEEVYHRRRDPLTVPGHFTDADLWVEPQVWDDVLELCRQASYLIHGSAKPPRTEGTVRASLSILGFRMKEGR